MPTDIIFGDHFDMGDSYNLRRPIGIDNWLIVYTLSGEGYFRTPSGEKRCGAGQIGILRAGVPHEYGTVKGQRWNFFWAHFRKLPESDYLPNEEILIHGLPEGYLQERVYSGFRNFFHDSQDRSSFWVSLCENTLRDMILLIAQRLEKKIDSRIEQALQLLSQTMANEIRIDDLAKSVGLSSSRLSHLFKQEVGVSVLEHLNGMRLRQAALLMEHMGRTATEASLDVGFNNYNHFATLFRKAYQMSPRHFVNRKDSP
jgi:AraC family transcriptional regulator of arabinose operon